MVGEYLVETLLTLENVQQQLELRKSVEHLQGLYRRHDPGGREVLKERLESLARSLPPLNAGVELRYLLKLKPLGAWRRGAATGAMRPVVAALVDDGKTDEVWEILSEGSQAGVWDLGFVLATQSGKRTEYFEQLTSVFGVNPNGLLGYLVGLQRSGDGSIFDDFLDSTLGQSLPQADKLSLAARGPLTRGLGHESCLNSTHCQLEVQFKLCLAGSRI